MDREDGQKLRGICNDPMTTKDERVGLDRDLGVVSVEMTRGEVLLGLVCCPLKDRSTAVDTEQRERGSFGPLGSALDCDVARAMAVAISMAIAMGC